MAIDRNAGVLAWRPLLSQIGAHDVILRVQDSRGGVALQSFQINVIGPESAPVITTLPPGPAVLDKPYRYVVRAQDAEGEPLTFTLASGAPSGMSLAPSSTTNRFSVLEWTPTLAQLGVSNHIELFVRDPGGAEARQGFDLEVVASADNRAPVFVSSPRTKTRITLPYAVRVKATDADGDPLAFQLVAGPPEMAFTPSGVSEPNSAVLQWTPNTQQLGSHPVTIRANDGRGGIVDQSFVIEVGSTLENGAPVVVSTPPVAATAGQVLEYNLVAEDPDQDIVVWQLISGPLGTSLDAETGALRWIPTLDQLGTNVFLVEVQDPFLGTDQQEFSVDVGCVNRPPSIVSTPPVSASKEGLYLYAPRANDPEEDRLTWSLIEPPAGMTANATNGLVRWPVPADAVGAHVVRLQVSDGRGGSDTQTYSLYVTDERANKPPVITSTPARGVTGGRTYTYAVTATDADGDLLTLQLLQGPPGATLVPGASLAGRSVGSVSWTPPVEASGPFDFVVVAKDTSGASAGQRFSVNVRANQAPRITSFPRTNAIPNVAYRYDLFASDPDADPLTYRLTEAPAGMAVDGLGRVQWQPTASQLGSHDVAVEVEDGFGGVAQQAFQIVVTADREPPLVSLSLISGLVNLETGGWAGDVGSTILIRLQATDNVGVVATTLRVGSEVYPLNASGVASIPVTFGGFPALVGEARDASGNVGTNTHPLQFRDPHATNSIFVDILSPSYGSVVTKRVPIVATITNATAIASYQVDFAPSAEINLNQIGEPNAAWQLLNQVNLTQPTNVLEAITVGTFDPLSLLNDSYLIRIYVQPQVGDGWYEPLLVSVEGELKFGEFRIAFNDLTVPLAGIPITVSRVYDSRLAGRNGDFGYGWSLGLQDAMIRVDSRDGTVQPGSRVYLTGPDGRRLGFTTEAQGRGGFGFVAVSFSFRPDAGIYERLEADGLADAYVGGSSVFGASTLNSARLITRDGIRYEYSRTAGLQSITDTSGNILRYTADGIFHYPAGSTTSDQSIQFVRDARGRIERVVPPQGPPLVYTYDAAGDLRAFTDLGENVTRYGYDSVRAHFLTNIVDPFGKSALGLVYDESGKLMEVQDAAGNPVKQDFNAEENIGTFTDARGTQTIVRFDDRGNETMRTVPGVSTNYFAYDERNNLTNAVNGRGYATNFVYDAKGNVTRITDALTNVTEIAYNELGKPTAVTNALGQVLRLQYDQAGHLTEVINNLGYVTQVGRDGQGRVTNLVDAVGNTNSFVYEGGCSCGRPGIVFNPDGSFRRYEYDAFGRTNLVVNELGATNRFNYAPDGRLLWVEDALTDRTTYLYNGSRLTNILDALGRKTEFRYDEFGRTNQIITAEGGTNEFRYDENGNRTHVIDAVGNVTRFVYDAANRVTNRIDTFGRTNHFVLDAMGNQIETIDRNGRRRTFAYDALGRMTNEVWWEGSKVVKNITFGFNELGVQTLAADDAARYDYRFDALNRLERVIQAAAGGQAEFSLFYVYTANGQVESVTDNWGVTVGSRYDNRNRLERRTWQGPGLDPARVDFGYDPSGSRVRTDRYADLAGANRIGFTTNAYNVAGVVTNITHLGPAGEALARYDYDFDAAWQIRQWTINNEASHFDYDQTGQLTNALNTATELPDERFRYDANGNRVGAQSGGIYVTNLDNQILSDGTNTYAYDPEGNMASRSNAVTGVLTAYQWDHRNRLVKVLDYNSLGVVTQTVAFEYDVMNRRLAKTVNGQTTRFLYNGDDSWADLDGGNVVLVRYLHGARIDELLARQRATEGRGWYLTDHLGTVRDLASGSGAVVAHVDYSSFGKMAEVSNPDAVDRFLFSGRELDMETGLLFYRARYYSCELGRFLTQDPIGFDSDDWNAYRYAKNSAIMYTDPMGTISMLEYNAIVFSVSLHTTVIYGAYCYEASGDRFGSARKALALGIAIYTTFANIVPRFLNALGVIGFGIQIPDLKCRPEQ